MTLIEILAGCAIVGLLLFAMTPAFTVARARAEQAVSLANIRQHCQVFAAYCTDYSGTYPFVTRPDADWTVLRSGSTSAAVRFFDVYFTWNIALAPGYYEGDHRSRSFMLPTIVRESGGGFPLLSDYFYSNAFITDWRYWDRTTRLNGRSQWRPVRDDQPTFPSKKGLFIAGPSFFKQMPGFPASCEVGFADGSASDPPIRSLLTPYPRGNNAYPQGSATTAAIPVVHTRLGYRGRDVQ